MNATQAPDSDAIPAEIYKAGGHNQWQRNTDLFHCMWMKEAIPQEFEDASTIHLYTSGREMLKSVTTVETSLYCRLRRILLNHLNEHLDQAGLLPENQWGFRKVRDTIDTIVTARPLVRTQYLQRSVKQEVNLWQRNLQTNLFHCM